MPDDELPFWETTPLDQMTPTEWESLCDGCGRCCTHVVRDEDTDEIARLAVSCRLLDTQTCRCLHYEDRFERVPGCVRVTPQMAHAADWLPATCAYRLLAQNEPLRWWHPLVSGDRETVHAAGVSVRGRVVSEDFVDEDEALHFVLEPPADEDAP